MLKRIRQAKWAVWILSGLTVIALLADVIAADKNSARIPPLIPYAATTIDTQNADFTSPFAPQSVASYYERHWLGTDQIGRDVAAGLIAGTRTTLLIGIGSVSIALLIGLILGLASGYYGDNRFQSTRSGLILRGGSLAVGIIYFFISIQRGIGFAFLMAAGAALLVFIFIKIILFIFIKINKKKDKKRIVVPIDMLIMRFVDVMKSVPTILWLLGLLTLVRGLSVFELILLIGVSAWMGFARLIRGEVIRLRDADFIEAARALGLSDGQIILRHILPNIATPIIIAAVFGIAECVLLEAFVSFIGLGLPAEQVTWGSLLSQAKVYFGAWWLAVFPGLLIFITVISLQAIGKAIDNFYDG